MNVPTEVANYCDDCGLPLTTGVPECQTLFDLVLAEHLEKPAVHFYGPVFARFDLIYGLRVPDPTILFLPLFVLVLYDFVVARRLHRATMWVALLSATVWIPGYLLLMQSRAPDVFIAAVR